IHLQLRDAPVGCAKSELPLTVSLQGKKEKRLVLTVVNLRNVDGPAKAAAEILFPFLGARAASGVVGETVGVEGLIPQLPEQTAMRRVLAGPHHEIEHAAAGSSILRGKTAGLDFELLEGLHRNATFAEMTCQISCYRRAIQQYFLG